MSKYLISFLMAVSILFIGCHPRPKTVKPMTFIQASPGIYTIKTNITPAIPVPVARTESKNLSPRAKSQEVAKPLTIQDITNVNTPILIVNSTESFLTNGTYFQKQKPRNGHFKWIFYYAITVFAIACYASLRFRNFCLTYFKKSIKWVYDKIKTFT